MFLGQHMTVMTALFGRHIRGRVQGKDTVKIGEATVKVGGAPAYVQGKDVYTRDFWLQSISQVLARLFTLTTKHSHEQLTSEDEQPHPPKGPQTIDDVQKVLIDQIEEIPAQLKHPEPAEAKRDKVVAMQGQIVAKVGQGVVNVGHNEQKVGQVAVKVDEVMRVIQRREWTDEELEELFWIIHEMIQSGAIEIGDGKITIDGNDYYLKDIIAHCCPLG